MGYFSLISGPIEFEGIKLGLPRRLRYQDLQTDQYPADPLPDRALWHRTPRGGAAKPSKIPRSNAASAIRRPMASCSLLGRLKPRRGQAVFELE